MKRLRLFGILGAIVAVVIAFGLYERGQAARNALPKFETSAADRGPVVARVTATGTLSALVTVQVGTQVSGRLSQILVDYNSPVKKGQLIAKIDPQLFLATVEQARANVAAQKGQVDQAAVNARIAELQRKRSRELRKGNLIAQADLDTAEATADAAQANVAVQQGQLAQSKANLHQAEVNLDYTTILSPTDGVVISRAVDVGQTVAASLQAPVLFTIAQDLKKMQVDTSVAEADVGKLDQGVEATFTVDAYPTEKFKGKVRQVRNAPQTLQNVVTYDAVLDVDNTSLKLKPGMTANVTFIYAEKQDVLHIPNAALRFRPTPEMLGQDPKQGGHKDHKDGKDHKERSPDRKTVWVLRDGKPAAVPIKVGISDGTISEVAEGELTAGDLVITEVASGATKPSGQQPAFRGGRMF